MTIKMTIKNEGPDEVLEIGHSDSADGPIFCSPGEATTLYLHTETNVSISMAPPAEAAPGPGPAVDSALESSDPRLTGAAYPDLPPPPCGPRPGGAAVPTPAEGTEGVENDSDVLPPDDGETVGDDPEVPTDPETGNAPPTQNPLAAG